MLTIARCVHEAQSGRREDFEKVCAAVRCHSDGQNMLPCPEKMAAYRRTARQKQAQRQLLQEKRRAAALVFAQDAAALLKNAYGAERVILFGSLARQGIFDEHSDVDLAVQGIDERMYCRVLAQLMNLQPDISVDLIRMEEAQPSLLDAIALGITL
jgi:predicted CxxxxCH...CXXCH cytochrome family protein